MEIKDKIKELRESTGMNRKEFCEYFEIPYRTVTEWERGTRKMPDYVCQSINYPISPRIWLVRPEQISISPIRFRRSTDRQWKVPLSGYRQKC